MDFYIIYIGIITALFGIDYILHPDKRNVLTFVGIIIVLLVTCLRYETGYDYQSYQFIYDSEIGFNDNLEPGIIALISFLKFIGAGSEWMFAIFGVLIIGLAYRGISLYTTNVRLAFLIYLLIPGLYLNSLSILRQSLAIVLMFNAYYYYYHRDYKKFWAFTIPAFLFHFSALFIIPFFWFAQRISKHTRLFFFIAIPLSLVLGKINIFSGIADIIFGESSKYIQHFATGGDEQTTSFAKLLVLNMALIPYMFFYKRMDKEQKTILCLSIIGISLLNIFSNVIVVTRITYYFRIFDTVLLANYLFYFKKGYSRIIVASLIYLYFLTMFLSSLNNDYQNIKEYPKLTPYKSLFKK